MVGLAFMATLGAAAPAAAQSIDQRSNQQGQRIRQGERTGALTQPKRAASDIGRVDSAAPGPPALAQWRPSHASRAPA